MRPPDRLALTPEEATLFWQLVEWAGLDPQQAAHRLIKAGLAVLRLEAAIRLYTTTTLSTGEIADPLSLALRLGATPSCRDLGKDISNQDTKYGEYVTDKAAKLMTTRNSRILRRIQARQQAAQR